MTGVEIINLAKEHGVEVTVFLDKLRMQAEGEPDERLIRLLRDHKQEVIDALLEAETEPDRWRRRLAEKIETVMRMRALSRREAEREAFQHLVVEHLNATYPNTDHRICAHCRGPDLPLTPTLPFGVGDRHAWLHDRCWAPWREARRAAAVKELAAMGIEQTQAAAR
jgi:hypothetical protein